MPDNPHQQSIDKIEELREAVREDDDSYPEWFGDDTFDAIIDFLESGKDAEEWLEEN
jgi:hypothetical protein